MNVSDAKLGSPLAYSYPLLIKQILLSPLARTPDQEIVYGDTHRYCYRDLARRVHQFGHALARLGVAHGATVAVMDWDSHRYLECFFAVPMYGAVLQTVNVRLSPDQILYTLNHAGATVLLVNREFLPLLAQIRSGLTSVQQIILLEDEPGVLQADLDGEYEALLAPCPDHYEFADFDENTRATTFYTTGTTGDPKGVFFSHRQLVLHTLAVTSALALAPVQGRFHHDDVYMPITPMFHVHAWGLPYVATMAGVKQVYPGRYQPEQLLKLIEREGVTFSHCVPTIMQMLLQSPYQADLSRWKVIVAGSALSSALARAALARGIDIFAGYGMSETCPILSFAQVDTAELSQDEDIQLATRIKTGRPIPLVDLRTVDAGMNSLPRDGVTAGEVIVRAPWLTQGYLHNPQASDQLWEGGWLHTQDIGHIDARGYLRITDRMKDVIKTGGEWVSSIALEELISRHPAVNESAVIGVADEKWGERPLALVVLKEGFAGQVRAEDIQAHLLNFVEQGHLSKFGVPEQIRFVEQLPRTSVGKLNKRAMREQQA